MMLLEQEAKQLFSALNPRISEGAGLVIQFIGSNPNQGTSTLAREFAITAASLTRQPVLLLNLDVAEQIHHDYFARQPLSTGIAPYGTDHDVDVDTRQILRCSRTDSVNAPMDFVYSGSDSLTLSRLKQPLAASGSLVNAPNFWTSLRKQFVLTVVDSLPASKGVDGIMLSASMDGVVVVIAAESTRSPIVMSLLERLQGQGAPVLGAVLNKRKFYIPQLIYRWLDRL